jgi:hypothetical protein
MFLATIKERKDFQHTSVVTSKAEQKISNSTFHHVDLHRLHVHALLDQPFDGRFHLVARAVQFQADDADLVGDAGLADVGYDLEFLPDLIDERFFDELGRIHQPQARLLRRIRFRRESFFLGWHK